MSKPMAESRTYWFNSLNVMAAVIVYWQAPEALTPEVGVTWLTIKGIVNIVLRKLTTTRATVN